MLIFWFGKSFRCLPGLSCNPGSAFAHAVCCIFELDFLDPRISCFDIQGHLGDCWFLSAVAVLAEVSRISEVIITPEYNEEGIYTVRFCIQVFIYKHYL